MLHKFAQLHFMIIKCMYITNIIQNLIYHHILLYIALYTRFIPTFVLYNYYLINNIIRFLINYRLSILYSL